MNAEERAKDAFTFVLKTYSPDNPNLLQILPEGPIVHDGAHYIANHIKDAEQAAYERGRLEGAKLARDNILNHVEDTGADAFGAIILVWKINEMTDDELIAKNDISS